jgi:hypothetical protein
MKGTLVNTKIVRLGLVTAAAFVALLAGASSAGAATVTALPAAPSASGVPVVGGLADSLVGIATGTAYGAAGATMAVVNSLTGGAP